MSSLQPRNPVPWRPFGSATNNSRLPKDVPIVGLGCSSFSTFFWTPQEQAQLHGASPWTADGMDKKHPKVREWIETILYAVKECGINLLDTAPWYGHGTSEVVIGWAMEELLSTADADNVVVSREDLIINTKVGRYEAEPTQQFDFSKQATLASVERSLARMKCQYIDVLQLHDPEFAPSLEILLQETIPAMLECRQKGYCKALGMTGYPLVTQYQILQRSKDLVGADERIWDQSLTYGHYNLVNTSLFTQPLPSIPAITNDNGATTEPPQYASFADYCQQHNIGLLAAAPLNMGLLTNNILAEWHPASKDLQEACTKAASICTEEFNVDIATLALVFALAAAGAKVPCTIVGMKNVNEVKASYQVASRFHPATTSNDTTTTTTMTQKEMLQQVLTEQEYKAWQRLSDPDNGPFGAVWKNGSHVWDGVQLANKFWQQLEGQEQSNWHWK